MTAKQKFDLLVKNLPVKFVKEYKFDEKRKFRADWANIEPHKILLEYEGVFGGRSRHTKVIGYTNDCEKYNLATVNGWRVLRYTAKNYGSVVDDVNKIIKINNYV